MYRNSYQLSRRQSRSPFHQPATSPALQNVMDYPEISSPYDAPSSSKDTDNVSKSMEVFLFPNDIENTVLITEPTDPNVTLIHHKPGRGNFEPRNYHHSTWHGSSRSRNYAQETYNTSAIGLYEIHTTKIFDGVRKSRIQRPAPTKKQSVVAEIDWKNWANPTTVKSDLIGPMNNRSDDLGQYAKRGDASSPQPGVERRRWSWSQRSSADTSAPRPKWKGRARADCMRDSGSLDKIKANKFLYSKSRFSSSRYFIGDDGREYRWKLLRSAGCVLTRTDDDEEMARLTYAITSEGLFAGERKTVLRIHPKCDLDLDLLILTFVLMEKKRRDSLGDQTKQGPYDEEVPGDGGNSAGEA